MALKRLGISNFKSFQEAEVLLRDFNVFVGANASGKSNFVQVLKFLRDISDYGLDNAVSLQGGSEYIVNSTIGSSKDLAISIVFSEPALDVVIPRWRSGAEDFATRAHVNEVAYDFAVKFHPRRHNFTVTRDITRLECDFYEARQDDENGAERVSLGHGNIETIHASGKVRQKVTLPIGVTSPLRDDDSFMQFYNDVELPQNQLFLETPLFPAFPFVLAGPFGNKLVSDMAIYDFDPKLPKKAVSITGKHDLEEDGSNLAIVLKSLLEDRSNRRQLSALIRDLLPFVRDLDVERFADKSLMFNLREVYSGDLRLPASLMSDGTIIVTALVVAIYFQAKPIVVIEEPEKNIHPHLISTVVSMLKDASRTKQVILTTQSPEVVKHAGVDSLLLVSRDPGGYSVISRPTEEIAVQTFLSNDIGVDDLYIQGLLRIQA